MAKKSGRRHVGKAQRQRWRHVETQPVAPLAAPPADVAADKPGPVARPPLATQPSSPSGRAAVPAPRRSAGPLPTGQTDYSYVRQDLRRIGILTSTVVAILLILTFFLR